MRGQNHDDIMSRFISGMDFKHSVSELQEHCRLFTDVLEKLGGAAKMAANQFNKEWNKLILQRPCSLDTDAVDVSQSQSMKGKEGQSRPYQSMF